MRASLDVNYQLTTLFFSISLHNKTFNSIPEGTYFGDSKGNALANLSPLC